MEDKKKTLFPAFQDIRVVREKAEKTYLAFSPAEKAVALFFAVAAVFFLSLFLRDVNDEFAITVPKDGGALTEGIIGTPRFINPILAVSEADKDLTAIIYAGLMKVGEDGMVRNDLAEKVEKSEDGLEYTFTIRDDAFFHDGENVTADDVIFTIKTAQDPDIRSPRRPAWEGVKTEAVGKYIVKFRLSAPYDLFLENTTIGILPAHIWQNISPQEFQFSARNVNPIGAGPYFVKKITFEKNNTPKTYELGAFRAYKPRHPYISKITLNFYQNEEKAVEAVLNREIEGLSAISPINAMKLENLGYRVESIVMPRIFGAFFNQSKNPVLADKNIRKALRLAVDRDEIIDGVLWGYGTKTENPILDMLFAESATSTDEGSDNATTTPAEEALKILEKDGWTRNAEGILEKKTKTETLNISFSISTANVPELKRGAELLKAQWDRLGVKTEVRIFELSDFRQNVIRPRDFDVLFFGQAIGRNPDLFVHWHSSQRNDPGLNIVSYTNKTTDKILENIRKGIDQSDKAQNYRAFAEEIDNDIPAVFLYSPDFLYVMPAKVMNFSMANISAPEERFHNIEEWYIETEKILEAFNRK